MEEYWARRPLHIARNKENSFKQEQETKKRIIAKVPLPKEVGDLLKVSRTHVAYAVRMACTFHWG